MRDRARRSAVAALLAVVVLSAGAAQPPDTSGHAIPGFDRFMYALGQVESGGRYDAYNPTSGAYGKYQIIPSSWSLWAAQVLGSSSAPRTAANQEKVARYKVHEAFHRFGSWRVVAYWWLTGRSTRNEAYWSSYARRYVDKVMAIYRGTAGTSLASGVVRYGETYRYIAWTGDWQRAAHGAYAGDAVRWSTQPGATATFRFVGRSVAWMGPKGPTRGAARIYVDGVFVRTVDAGAASFRAVNTLFSKSWAASGTHVLVIEVVGTPGRPMVAIDEFRVGK